MLSLEFTAVQNMKGHNISGLYIFIEIKGLNKMKNKTSLGGTYFILRRNKLFKGFQIQLTFFMQFVLLCLSWFFFLLPIVNN